MQRLATLAGIVGDSFDKGADLLQQMSGVRLSASTVRAITEDSGRQLAEKLQAEQVLGEAQDWNWHLDVDGNSVAYVSIDATGVPQQGPHGVQAEGRMAQVGVIFNPLPDTQRVFHPQPDAAKEMTARYLSGLYPLAEMGPLMRRQGAQVGMDGADLWIGISDGGAGLEDFLDKNFPRTEVIILDFWHAAGYLADLAAAVHPGDEDKRESLRIQWCRLLEQEGGACTLAVLQASDLGDSAAVVEQLQTIREYEGIRLHQMDYPEYQARGWYIGSGTVESACKTVVGQRLKLAGMRWGQDGAHAVCHLRALYRSEPGQWQAFWERTSTN